jgi:exocyst complex component 4
MSFTATSICAHSGVNLAGLSMNLVNRLVRLTQYHIALAHGFLVQKVVFEEEGRPAESLKKSIPVSPVTPAHKSTRLSRYLDDLNIRANEPPYNLNEQTIPDGTSGAALQVSTSISLGLSSGPSRSSLSSLPGPSLAATSSSNVTQPNRNPETDSFAYMETLLEALAVLGKLGLALDIVAQKLPQEIYALVEATLDEAAERAEYGRRASMIGPTGGVNVGRQSDIYFQTGSGVMSLSSTYLGLRPGGHSTILPAFTLRLAALEMSTKHGDQEIMKDLFWTLYSKLDAVAQGLRVIYEVSNRIGSVSTILQAERNV